MQNIIAKSFTNDEFHNYVYGLKFNGWTPQFTVVHNTSAPTQKLYKEWHTRPNWTIEQWLHNLASYYIGLGWSGFPHLFVGYDKISVLNDLTMHGTHTPSWNKISWGVETIAEFDQEPFNDGVKDNLIFALATLHSRIGLNPADFKLGVRGLHLHKEDVGTTHKDCPGKNLVKGDLVKAVVAEMNSDGVEHIEIPIAVHTADVQLTATELFDIKWLQTELNTKISAGLDIDGKVGNQTKAAIKLFQAKCNAAGTQLTVDGIAGPLTRKALKNYNLILPAQWR